MSPLGFISVSLTGRTTAAALCFKKDQIRHIHVCTCLHLFPRRIYLASPKSGLPHLMWSGTMLLRQRGDGGRSARRGPGPPGTRTSWLTGKPQLMKSTFWDSTDEVYQNLGHETIGTVIEYDTLQ